MRHILSRLCMTVLAFAGLSRADVTLSFPAGAYQDSAAVNAVLPMRAFSDSLSSTTLTMTDKVAKLSVSWGNVPKWGAKAGIQLPFNNLWAPVDLSGGNAVSFKYKTSDAKTTVQFAPTSDLYPGIEDGVMMVAALGASAAGTTKTISLPSGITYLKWMNDLHAENATLTWDDVKAEIKWLQFQPMPVYNSTGDAVTVPSAWLEISEVRLQADCYCGGGGNVNWLSQMGSRCSGNYQKLSAFDGDKPLHNAEGGVWYGYSDSGALGKARGVSKLLDRIGDGTGFSLLPAVDSSAARLEATALLDKADATLHPYGGWAGIGTSFPAGTSGDSVRDLSGMKAISFQLAFGDKFDEANLTGVNFLVRNRSVGDSVSFNAGITPELVSGLGKSKEVCIDVAQFKMPAWFKQPMSSLPLSDILGFEWEVKINKDATINADTSTFSIGDVKLWGTNAANGISRSRTGAGPAFVASYSGALRLSYFLEDAASAKIEVLRIDGRSVASFEAPSSVQAQAFPVTLGQGTYLAVVRSGSAKLVAPFVVTR